jgi:hypothetical protein
MNKKHIPITIAVFILCAGGIAVFAFWPFGKQRPKEQHLTRLIVPSAKGADNEDPSWYESTLYEELNRLKAPLGEGEFVISVLNIDYNYDSIEEQIVVFRSTSDTGSRISVSLFSFDERIEAYRRLWTLPVLATMPGTVSLYAQDLLGDRSICIIVTGMIEQGDHTMTIFHKDPQEDMDIPFTIIAEIQMDGSITVQETDRPMAYQQGIGRGQPFTIAAYGRDPGSENLLDRIEIIYTFNQTQGLYQQSRITRIPGSQIEQRRLREILSGQPKAFEDFIHDLWYYVSPEGTNDRNLYIYFDPLKREIIFSAGDQQVFNWQRSNSTRFGLYVSSQNASITTMRRFLDIEMTSLDSIRMRVVEDSRLAVRGSSSWDGSYRRAGNAIRMAGTEKTINPYTDASYDSSMGRIRFYPNGEYELNSSGSVTKGRYVFFRAGDNDLMELRPENVDRSGASARNESGENRQVYRIANAGRLDENTPNNISMVRVRLGSAGIQELHEGQIIFTRVR